jgi:hypothetical protein
VRTFTEFEKAGRSELREWAKTCLDNAHEHQHSCEETAALLSEAQFYLAEIERRKNARIALRDLLLEIVVIVLIGGEIFEGNKEAAVLDKQLATLTTIQTNAATQADNDKILMDKQNIILGNLQRASDATAEAMKNLVGTSKKSYVTADATAKTLQGLQVTTEKMNEGVHDQLALFYDPSISFNYDSQSKRIMFINTGRSNITIKSVKVDGVALHIAEEMLLSVGGNYYVSQPDLYKSVETVLRKGFAKIIPVEAHIQNSLEKTFVLRGGLYFIWEDDKLTVHSQPSSIGPER